MQSVDLKHSADSRFINSGGKLFQSMTDGSWPDATICIHCIRLRWGKSIAAWLFCVLQSADRLSC